MIIEIHEELESTKCQYLLFECLLKKDLKEDQLRVMYEQIVNIFHQHLNNLTETLDSIKPLSADENGTEILPENKIIKSIQKAVVDSCTFANIN